MAVNSLSTLLQRRQILTTAAATETAIKPPQADLGGERVQNQSLRDSLLGSSQTL